VRRGLVGAAGAWDSLRPRRLSVVVVWPLNFTVRPHMPNQHLVQRLAGIQQILCGVHAGSGAMSTATSGHERAAFVDQFLAQAFPSPYRIGTGDATDAQGNRSGQLDVVIEYPVTPSVPLANAAARLYLAEGIAAVVEVKSNCASQWTQALATAAQLSSVKRSYAATVGFGAPPTADIPLFVAAYTGWNQVPTVAAKLAAAQGIDGVLIVDAGIFLSSPRFGSMTATGPLSLWGLVCCLHQATNSLASAATNPLAYAV
jgi:hypothetical protein